MHALHVMVLIDLHCTSFISEHYITANVSNKYIAINTTVRQLCYENHYAHPM